ncbi:MAG: sodium-dependent transporter, partial [Candidatus Ornithospirochaeta sp.]
LPGAMEGLKFYLVPSLSAVKEKGILSVVVAAMNQAFFTLSLGICAMEIFGTYMSKENTLLSESLRISLLDTFVAVVSGLIIFPSCFSFNVSPDAGPSLIFVTLPNVFVNMKGGRVWGTLFFVFMSFAALSTVIAVFENIIASFMDNFGWSRKKSVVINFIGLLILSIPCALENNLLKGVTILGSKGVLDSWDFLVSNLLLPGGSIAIILFCVWKNGWGWDGYLEEANTGKGMKMRNNKGMKVYLGIVLPVLVLIVMILGLI